MCPKLISGLGREFHASQSINSEKITLSWLRLSSIESNHQSEAYFLGDSITSIMWSHHNWSKSYICQTDVGPEREKGEYRYKLFMFVKTSQMSGKLYTCGSHVISAATPSRSPLQCLHRTIAQATSLQKPKNCSTPQVLKLAAERYCVTSFK